MVLLQTWATKINHNSIFCFSSIVICQSTFAVVFFNTLFILTNSLRCGKDRNVYLHIIFIYLHISCKTALESIFKMGQDTMRVY